MVITSLSLMVGAGPDARTFLPAITLGNASSIQQKHVIMKSSRLMVPLLCRFSCRTEESKSHEPFFAQGNLHIALASAFTARAGSTTLQQTCYLVTERRLVIMK